jgi:membrane protein
MPPGPTSPPAWVERLQALALRIFDSRRVIRARRVIDRYNLAGGGLLAAGIAYNTLFAIIPMALFGGAILGFFVKDPASLENVKHALTDWAPPLAGVVDEILGSLATASPSLSIIGLVGMIWGATRLFASLEMGIEAMFSEAPRRGIVARTLRRVASVLIVAGIIAAAFLATSVASFVSELMVGDTGGIGSVFLALLLALPAVVTTLALIVVYERVPPVRPSRAQVLRPAIVIGVGLVLLTRIFAVVAPRALGANFVYGTLGAIFVSLAWLGLAYSMILIGAAWARERMLATEETAAVA